MYEIFTDVVEMRVNDVISPIGARCGSPRFSWGLSSNVTGQKQTAYRLVLREKTGAEVWDSGRVESSETLDVICPLTLKPATEYVWTVTSWDKDGLENSSSAVFETALLPGELESDARFISYGGDDGDHLPVYRKCVRVGAGLKSARLYTTALGVYESYINGARVGRVLPDGNVEYHELKPGSTEMAKRKYYNTYDVTRFLEEGENAITSVVTSGWWSGLIAAKHGKKTAYLAKLVLVYDDGRIDTVVTDESWKSACVSPVISGDIYNGESYDATVDTSYMKPGFDDSAWTNAVVNNEYDGAVDPWLGSFITVREDLERDAVKITVYRGATGASEGVFGRINVISEYSAPEFVLEPGETALVDFGQNFSGWEKFTVRGPAGTKLHIEHGEMLNDRNGERSRGNDGPGGSIYNENYRSAKELTEYVLRGGEPESYHPSFTYYGFRYIEITTDAAVEFSRINAEVVTSVEIDTASIETSDERINRLISNIRWGQYSNYLSVPTDCPQRDERLGWTADTQVFTETGCYFGDSKGFFAKYLQDLRDAQAEDGSFPGVAPTGQYHGGDWGGTGWADAGIIIPWTVYEMYGDPSVIRDSWDSMKKYIDGYLGASDKKGPKNIWGDWLAYESNDAEIQSILAVAYYAWDALLMAKMADAIGKPDEAAAYRDLYETEKRFYIEQYVKEDGSVVRPEQTICLYSLYLDLLPDDNSRAKVLDMLVSDIENHGNRLQTGFLGTRILLDTLTMFGKTELAYTLLLQDANPSWLYSVNQGATTIWERWNSYTIESGFGDVGMNSFNHYAYGAVAAWMFHTMVGVRFDESAPGFRRIIVSPVPDARLPEISASFASRSGQISVDSSFSPSRWLYDVTIPENTSAAIFIPVSENSTLTVNGKPVSELSLALDGVAFTGVENEVARFEAVASSLSFERNTAPRP